ncbi:hypothetical protein PanWU01x14_338200 [Parasponia andersonii]|uniref:Uncharacterized protein n=1 Tax=Parasponia andersonii TaxID=3476 RepID=A0A2P5AFB0_PARAD|nr:hypothetical protein PanWU01x14_338200 [Parasponia andersonii]
MYKGYDTLEEAKEAATNYFGEEVFTAHTIRENSYIQAEIRKGTAEVQHEAGKAIAEVSELNQRIAELEVHNKNLSKDFDEACEYYSQLEKENELLLKDNDSFHVENERLKKIIKDAGVEGRYLNQAEWARAIKYGKVVEGDPDLMKMPDERVKEIGEPSGKKQYILKTIIKAIQKEINGEDTCRAKEDVTT